jgi:FixJ family two-component response regulator
MASMIRQEFHAEIPAIVLTGETPAEDLHVADIFLLHKPANAFRIRTMLASIAQAMQNGTVKSPAAASPFEMGPGRIHFIDADQTLREHIQRHFEDIPCDIVTFSSAEAFLASQADDPSPPVEGCVVTNIAMPGMSGIDLLRQVRGRGWSLPVIIVAEDGKVETAIHAMRLGANDVIEKPFDGDDLAAAIVRCMGTHGAATRPLSDSARAKSRLSVLTERERDVMAKVIQGLPNKVIAFEHGVSQRTIEFQRRSMMTKLGVKTVPDLVRLAISARIFPL